MYDVINIEVPREIAAAAHMTAEDLRVELAIHLFEQNKISFGKASELARINEWDFMQLLGTRGIPMHYDIEEYEHDKAALRELKTR